MALIQAGPPPLQALALNRCELSGAALTELSAACPQLEVGSKTGSVMFLDTHPIQTFLDE